MAMSLGTDDKELDEQLTSWEICPPEILLMIFELLPAHSLASCMYVNSKWRTLAEHVAENHNKWKDIFDEIIPRRGDDFKQKSRLPIDYKNLFNNYELWNNLNNAVFMFKDVFIVDNIKKVNIYRDNLIVVTYDKVIYFDCGTFQYRKSAKIQSCHDFYENDYMIVIAYVHKNRYTNLSLYKKASIDDFNLDKSNVFEVEKVVTFRVDNKGCYVLNDRSILFAYIIYYPEWSLIYSMRYYGNPGESCFVHAYNDQVFLMLKSGVVLYAHPYTKSFVKILEAPPPLVVRSSTIYGKMFHKCGFVYGVDISEKFEFKQFCVGKNNVSVYLCPNVSCVMPHGEILILGYLHGEVEFHMPRLKTKNSLIRRFNIKDFKRRIKDCEIVSIDICEDKGLHLMYIATLYQVIKLKILHNNADKYMFKNKLSFAEIVPESTTSFSNF